jgi:hypothetical protein
MSLSLALTLTFSDCGAYRWVGKERLEVPSRVEEVVDETNVLLEEGRTQADVEGGEEHTQGLGEEGVGEGVISRGRSGGGRCVCVRVGCCGGEGLMVRGEGGRGRGREGWRRSCGCGGRRGEVSVCVSIGTCTCLLLELLLLFPLLLQLHKPSQDRHEDIAQPQCGVFMYLLCL